LLLCVIHPPASCWRHCPLLPNKSSLCPSLPRGQQPRSTAPYHLSDQANTQCLNTCYILSHILYIITLMTRQTHSVLTHIIYDHTYYILSPW
jgi:hypothetical protein